MNGMIALVKLSSNTKKEKKSSAAENILDNIEIKSYDNSLQISVEINRKNISDFRNNTLLKNFLNRNKINLVFSVMYYS
jgi:hypothetical protein